jgi:hypothetical protein
MYEHNNTLDPACKRSRLSGARGSLSVEFIFGGGTSQSNTLLPRSTESMAERYRH